MHYPNQKIITQSRELATDREAFPCLQRLHKREPNLAATLRLGRRF
jgi:hypothetical protein